MIYYCFSLMVFAGSYHMIPVFRSHIQEYLAIDLKAFGLLLSVSLIPSIIGSLIGGWSTDRFGATKTLQNCLLGLLAGFLMLSWPNTNFTFILTAIGVCASFSPGILISIQILITSRENVHLVKNTSMSLLVGSLPCITYPYVAETLIDLTSRLNLDFGRVFHTTFISTSLILGLYYLISFKVLEPYARVQKPKKDKANPNEATLSVKSGGLTKEILFLCFLIILLGASDCACYIWLPRVLEQEAYRISIQPGHVLSLFTIFFCASRIILSVVKIPFLEGYLIFLPSLLGALLLFAGITYQGGAYLGYAYIAGGFIWAFQNPLLLAACLRKAGLFKGRCLTIQMVGTHLFSFLLSMGMSQYATHFADDMRWIITLPCLVFIMTSLGALAWKCHQQLTQHKKTASPMGIHAGHA